jgi:hypothetical protein
VDGFWNKVHGQKNATLSGALSDNQAGEPTWLHARIPAPGEAIHDFTCLIGVPLSAQREIDAGNLGLLRGGHHLLEAAFRCAAVSVIAPDWVCTVFWSQKLRW